MKAKNFDIVIHFSKGKSPEPCSCKAPGFGSVKQYKYTIPVLSSKMRSFFVICYYFSLSKNLPFR